jgi:hypothetical protein
MFPEALRPSVEKHRPGSVLMGIYSYFYKRQACLNDKLANNGNSYKTGNFVPRHSGPKPMRWSKSLLRAACG